MAAKSRFFYVHPSVNTGKIAALEALQEVYASYLEICVTAMLDTRRSSLVMSERRGFFPPAPMSSQIAKNCHAHAVQIVSGWAASLYERKLRGHIRQQHRSGAIGDDLRVALHAVGKSGVDAPGGRVTQAALDLYWSWLLDESIAGRRPTISERCGMRMSEMTCVLSVGDRSLTQWWFSFSHLGVGEPRIQLPLVANPFVTQRSDVVKSALVRKVRGGRWRVEMVEDEKAKGKAKVEIPSPKGRPVIGVDVGLNVLAATSAGDLLGADFKPKFDARYAQVREVRRNRMRQGLYEDSPRRAALEQRLTGLIKTAAGTVVNDLLRRYPGHAFAVEDLDLRGCKGQKRYAYRAVDNALARRAPRLPQNPAYTSQMCPACGYVSRQNRRGTSFLCRSCGKKAHADVVGGINLLRRSEDKQIGLDDHHADVGNLLRARYRHRRDSASVARSNAPAPSGRRLTARVRARIALNQGLVQ